MAAVLLLGIPVAALFAYDAIVLQPHLAQIETLLADSEPGDLVPPQQIRDLIDANAGSPTPHATRLMLARVYPDPGSAWRRHLHGALWRVLLPLHFSRTRMYGVYAALSFNGIDRGLSRFARREYGSTLAALSPQQAAMTVAMTHAPGIYLRDPSRLRARADALLQKTGHPPMDTQATPSP